MEKTDRYRQAAIILRAALEEMVGQHGGSETCLSANEHAEDVLKWAEWLAPETLPDREMYPWVTDEMRKQWKDDQRKMFADAGIELPDWLKEA